MRTLKEQPALLALMSAVGIITTLCLAFDPLFETNDDVGMSMIAHGYGLAEYGSPHLIFSNVLWGYLVRAIPAINGVLGYSLATLAVLLAVGWAMLYFLLRLGAGYFTGLLVVALLIARPVLLPQFTINAGLLTATAIIGWQVYARFGGAGNLAVACLLAFLGYLIRDNEFLLVLGVALPLLPWRALRERRQMQVAFILLGAAIASAAAFDRWSYSGPEWQRFMELNSVRVQYTDFGAGDFLKQRPEVLAQYGYSQNDMDLVKNWFFIDPQIADPKPLNAMLAELGPLSTQEGSVPAGFAAIKALVEPELWPLIFPALFFLVLAPGRPVVLAWALCLAALFAIGVMGRPGLMRVYVPLVSLLLFAPLVAGKLKERARQWVVALTLIAACVWNAGMLIPHTLSLNKSSQLIQWGMRDFSAKTIVVWGISFPFVLVYPVLDNNPHLRSIKLYGLNSFTHAPFSVATAEQAAGRGMLERLQTAEGIPIVSSTISLLRIYCEERLNGQLRVIAWPQTPAVQQVSCRNSQGNFR